MVELARDPTAKTFTRIFVDDVENTVGCTVMGLVLHEIIAQDMLCILGT
jgi:hypothetical protein